MLFARLERQRSSIAHLHENRSESLLRHHLRTVVQDHDDGLRGEVQSEEDVLRYACWGRRSRTEVNVVPAVGDGVQEGVDIDEAGGIHQRT